VLEDLLNALREGRKYKSAIPIHPKETTGFKFSLGEAVPPDLDAALLFLGITIDNCKQQMRQIKQKARTNSQDKTLANAYI